jgi:hypothetical protein
MFGIAITATANRVDDITITIIITLLVGEGHFVLETPMIQAGIKYRLK